MKRFMWLATLSFVLLMSFGMHVQAEPKEVTEAVTVDRVRYTRNASLG